VKLSRLSIIAEHKTFALYLKDALSQKRGRAKFEVFNWEQFAEAYLSTGELPFGVILVNLFEKFNQSHSRTLLSFRESKTSELFERSYPPLDFLRMFAHLSLRSSPQKMGPLPKLLFLHVAVVSKQVLSAYLEKPEDHFLQIPVSVEGLLTKLEHLPESKFIDGVYTQTEPFLLEALQPHGPFEGKYEGLEGPKAASEVFNVLLADDRLGRPSMAFALGELINQVDIVRESRLSFRVFGETSAAKVYSRILTGIYDLLILDKQFATREKDGEAILKEIRRVDPVEPIIVFTGKYADNIEKASQYGTQFGAAYFEKGKLLTKSGEVDKRNLHLLVNLIIDRIQSVRSPHVFSESKNGKLSQVNNLYTYEVMRWWAQRSIKEALSGNQGYCAVFVSNNSNFDVSFLSNRLLEFLTPYKMKGGKLNPPVGFGDFHRSCLLLILPFYEKGEIFRRFREFDQIVYGTGSESRKCFIFLPDDLPKRLKIKISTSSAPEPNDVHDAIEYVMSIGRLINKSMLAGPNNFIHI